jgi:hypothetical protein
VLALQRAGKYVSNLPLVLDDQNPH